MTDEHIERRARAIAASGVIPWDRLNETARDDLKRDDLAAQLAVAVEALAGLLTHPGIADMDPRDKDPEDHALERVAREARDSLPARAKAMLKVVGALHHVSLNRNHLHPADWEIVDKALAKLGDTP